MSIIELILVLQVNGFSIPQKDEVTDAVNKAYECQQHTEYHEQCANIVEKFMHTKYELGGTYVNFQ